MLIRADQEEIPSLARAGAERFVKKVWGRIVRDRLSLFRNLATLDMKLGVL